MRGAVPSAAGQQRAVPCVRQKGGPHGGVRQMRQAICPAARRALAQDLPRLPARTAHKGSARAIFWRYGPKAADQKPPISAASAEKAPPRRRQKGKGPGGALGALLADLDKENARRGKKGLPPLSYGKYVQLFGR